MARKEGSVSGLDVIATTETPLRCLAFVGDEPLDEVQVETEFHQLQTALETATAKQARVEVYYADDGPPNTLSRVRLLDR